MRAAVSCVLGLVLAGAAAPGHGADSTERTERVAVTAVTLYPGSASVERTAQVTPGTTEVVFACLSAGLDAQTLRALAPPEVRIGEIRINKVTASTGLDGCRHTGVDDRIRSLEDEQAAVAADQEANEVLAAYLKSLKGAAEDRNGAVTDLRSLGASSEALRRTAEQTFRKRQAFARRIEELDRQLAEAVDERERLNTKNQNYETVVVHVRAERPGEVRLIYQVNQAGWTPTYRAQLDTASGALTIERGALIAQASGEAWSGVRMKLSTAQPRANIAIVAPQSWQVGIAAPVAAKAYAPSGAAMLAAPAPAPAASRAQAATEPLFEASAFQGVYATEYTVASPVTLPGDAQRLAVVLERQPVTAKLTVRVVPREEAAAYLVVESERQPGVWPRGQLVLVRDGAVVGSLPSWSPEDGDHFSIPFGRDDLVRVTSLPKSNFNATSGLFGGRIERRIGNDYELQNLHTAPIALEVLEASPVSTDEQVEVKRVFEPPVSVDGWNDRPGVVAWRQQLAAQGKAHFESEYTIKAPKDARVTGF